MYLTAIPVSPPRLLPLYIDTASPNLACMGRLLQGTSDACQFFVEFKGAVELYPRNQVGQVIYKYDSTPVHNLLQASGKTTTQKAKGISSSDLDVPPCIETCLYWRKTSCKEVWTVKEERQGQCNRENHQRCPYTGTEVEEAENKRKNKNKRKNTRRRNN